MAGRENEKVKQIFPPLNGKNAFAAIENEDNYYTEQSSEKRRVKKAPMTKEIEVWDVKPSVADDVGIREGRACNA